MDWGSEINCHGDITSGGVFRFENPTWHAPEPQGRPTMMSVDNKWIVDPAAGGAPGPYGSPYRTCSYDGSIHPEDLYNWLLKGATAGGSDWKYGWPHKFYIDNIPNPLAGKRVCDGGTYGGPDNKHELHFSLGPEYTQAKFYNVHLDDIKDVEAFKLLTELLHKHTGVLFSRNAGALMYKAPSFGYQR